MALIHQARTVVQIKPMEVAMVEMQGDGNQLVEEVVEVTGVASKDDFNRKITTPTITTTEEVVVVKIPRAVINGKKMKTVVGQKCQR